MADKEVENRPADNAPDKGATYKNVDADTPKDAASVSHKSGTGSDLTADDRFTWKIGEVRFFDKDGRPVTLAPTG